MASSLIFPFPPSWEFLHTSYVTEKETKAGVSKGQAPCINSRRFVTNFDFCSLLFQNLRIKP